jgi:hypothetical protein
MSFFLLSVALLLPPKFALALIAIGLAGVFAARLSVTGLRIGRPRLGAPHAEPSRSSGSESAPELPKPQ